MSSSAHIASVKRDGDALVFSGTLDRQAVPALWTRCAAWQSGITRLDLAAVDRVDSAGVALLAELAARTGATTVAGEPTGLAELRRAYRLGATLNFAT
ncbi:STAS domain-containing protein [Novilysobacter antarcticus]|uniref:STAS domain-containing protein n=1 Tax=Novilysobacter antarcticus TaxID=2862543 RepID=UPI001C994AD7|nr:STAS domain-containing protein [Lysobacter antarcticus]